MGKHHQGREVQVMKFQKVIEGYYVSGKWIISKRWGNWDVIERNGFREEFINCFGTFKEAKEFVSAKEAK
jgi:hypothetical protein